MIRLLKLIALSLVTTAPAAAAGPLDAVPGSGCPWSEVETVAATMTTVYINGEAYYVSGYEARTQFLSYLHSCDNPAAAASFEMWRQDRRATNITAISGIFVAPVWIGTAIFGMRAGGHKLQMMDELLHY